MHSNTEHHPAFEEYCECIFELEEDNVELIQARIAERLGVSRASGRPEVRARNLLSRP
ncbi:MAG: hypothetical protein EBV02_06635 [Actinobacteria bacterium]|nr:hypothetical protein [Actinomycetota bacterium]